MKFNDYDMNAYTGIERRFLAQNKNVQDIIRDDLQMKLGWVKWHWDFQTNAWMEDDELLVCEWALLPRDVLHKDLVLAQSFFA
jgi:hypothetical protein